MGSQMRVEWQPEEEIQEAQNENRWPSILNKRLLCQRRSGATYFGGLVIDAGKFPRKTFLCRR
jgi:hypothetical protein